MSTLRRSATGAVIVALHVATGATASTWATATATSGVGSGVGAEAPLAQACDIPAFVDDRDPAGLRVREAPNAHARVLGSLPPVLRNDDGMDMRVFVRITGAANGWFHIRDASDNDALTGRPARRLYAGEGWVSGRLLVVKSQAQVGRQQPDVKAPVSVRLKEDAGFDGDSAVAAGRLVGCQGTWARVEFDESRLSADLRPLVQVLPAARAGLRPGRFRVWLNQLCGLQETTCDGLADEAAPESSPTDPSRAAH